MSCNTEIDEENWRTPILKYLLHQIQPSDKREAHKLRAQASRYSLTDGHLYRQSARGPYLKCLSRLESPYVLAEIHQG